MSSPQPGRSAHPLASMWVYTLLRIAVFAVILGILWVLGLRGLLGAAIAVVLAVPVSYVVLAKQRARLVGSMQERMGQRRERLDDLEAHLSGETESEHRDPPGPDGTRRD